MYTLSVDKNTTKQFSISEWDVDLPVRISKDNEPIYKRLASESINTLLKKINDKEDGIQYLAMFDEATADNDGYNFFKVFDGVDKPKALMGVNPGAEYCNDPLDIQGPIGQNVMTFRLLTKHRNSFHIANLLAHRNYYTMINSDYKVVSTAEDNELDANTLPLGHMPIWIKLGPTATDQNLCEYIYENLVKGDNSVRFLYSPNKELSPVIKSFCSENGWNVSTFWNLIGCEDETIIYLVEDNMVVPETFSRAKNKMVIITR